MSDNHLCSSAIPCLFDASLTALNSEQLQSGIGGRDDLQLQEIIPLSSIQWSPIINHGFYYMGLDSHYLYSDTAVRLKPTAATATLNLPHVPVPGTPVSVLTYRRDDHGNIYPGRHWRQKVRFSGTITVTADQSVEALALDDQGQIINYNLANADLSKAEFIVIHQPDCLTRLQLPGNLAALGAGVQEIILDPPAKSDLPLSFSNLSVFTHQVGGIPAAPGEWHLSLNGATLSVYVTDEATDPGQLTYYHKYPVQLLFAENFTRQHGEVTIPQILDSTEILGVADGSPHPCFYSRYFPWLSTDSTRVFVEVAGVITEWTIVNDLSTSGANDTHCMIDLDLGLVWFGDGAHGKVPPANARIGLIYTSVPLVSYEIRKASTVLGAEVNLHPLLNPSPQGFIYLQHRLDILSSLELTGNKQVCYCGNDYAILSCRALNPKGEEIANLSIEFISGEYGYFNLLNPGVHITQTTQANQPAQVVLHPPSNFMDLSHVVELYDQNGTYLNPYATVNHPHDRLNTPVGLTIDDFSDQQNILTFLVVDNDPLAPYLPAQRSGGTLVLLYHFDPATQNFIPTRPSAVKDDYIVYDRSLPTPADLPMLRKFVVALPRLIEFTCRATDPFSGRLVTSNSWWQLLAAPAYQLGPYTVRDALDQAGSAIGVATYLTIDKFGQLNAVFNVGAHS